MSQFMIQNQQNIDYTMIANSFVDHYLAEANDVQIKIYLYLLRHANSSKECSISSIADHFNYPEKDVLRALSYWERKKILQLKFDDNHELSGLIFCNPTANDSTPVVKTMTYMSHTATFVKPEYTLDQLAEFKSRQTTSELMFIAESYLGRTLSANDVRSILFISDELHFSFDLLDYLLQYCVDRGKRDFRYIEKVAISWAENNVTSVEQAQSQATKYDKDTYTVMNALGKTNQPTAKEAEYIKRWFQVYGFTLDVILEACERCVLATDKHRFEYADKILKNWHANGVHHRGDIAKADAAYELRKKNLNASATSVAAKNRFNQFKQNDYDFELLEKELLSN